MIFRYNACVNQKKQRLPHAQVKQNKKLRKRQVPSDLSVQLNAANR